MVTFVGCFRFSSQLHGFNHPDPTRTLKSKPSTVSFFKVPCLGSEIPKVPKSDLCGFNVQCQDPMIPYFPEVSPNLQGKYLPNDSSFHYFVKQEGSGALVVVFFHLHLPKGEDDPMGFPKSLKRYFLGKSWKVFFWDSIHILIRY